MTLLERLREQVERKENPATNPAGSQSISLAVSEARALLAVVEAARRDHAYAHPVHGDAEFYPDVCGMCRVLAPLTTETPNA